MRFHQDQLQVLAHRDAHICCSCKGRVKLRHMNSPCLRQCCWICVEVPELDSNGAYSYIRDAPFPLGLNTCLHPTRLQ
jgi:hypothetical protein